MLAKRIKIYLITFFGILVLVAILGAAALDWVGRRTGSTLRPEQLAAAQSASGTTIVFEDRIPAWGAFKQARTALLQPEVVFIGSSRGNSFRADMFRPYRFYNAAVTAWTIDQTRVMLDRMTRNASPKVAIIALDYWMFADQWATPMEALRSMNFDSWWMYKYRANRALLESIVRSPSVLPARVVPLLRGQPKPTRENLDFLGVDAMLHEVGFRPDGSFLQPAGSRATPDFDKNYMGSVLSAFPGGRRYDQKQGDALERLTALAQQRGVQLIAVQLPVAKSARDYLDNEKSYHRSAGLWRESHTEERRDILHELGVPYYDLSRLLDDNTDFLDAAHPTEKAMIKVLLHLSEQPEIRAALPKLDTQKLQADLAVIIDPEAPAVYPTR